MNNSERITIINSYKECQKDYTDATDLRITMNNKNYKLWLAGFFINVLFLMIAIINDSFNLNLVASWGKAALFFFLSLINLKIIIQTTFKKTLLSHLKFLENHQLLTTAKYNSELAILIKKLNGSKDKLGLIIFSVILSISAIYCMTMNFSFVVWKYAKIPVFLLYFYFAYYIVINNNKLKQNISIVENSISLL